MFDIGCVSKANMVVRCLEVAAYLKKNANSEIFSYVSFSFENCFIFFLFFSIYYYYYYYYYY